MYFGTFITIGDILYTIEFVDDLPETETQQMSGYTDFDECKIIINNNQIDQQKFNTLIHEVVHICLHALGYLHDGIIIHDEQFVNSFTTLMAQATKQIQVWNDFSNYNNYNTNNYKFPMINVKSSKHP